MIPNIPAFPDTRISELPTLSLVGVHVRTSMEKAAVDCPALWERFVPWMCDVCSVHGLKDNGFACASFGVSTDTDMQSGQFTYWAAIALRESFADATAWPAGFGTLTLAGGTYVGTGVADLSRLSEVYSHLYGPWIQQQNAYALNWGGNCFEYYDERYVKNGSFEVFVPLSKK